MKYYYTDPLVAAWMAKHWEMRFIVDGEMHDWATEISMPMAEYHIHPDSLILLEGKRNDIRILKDNSKLNLVDMVQRTSEYDGPAIDDEWPIIYRDGKHFFWPQHD